MKATGSRWDVCCILKKNICLKYDKSIPFKRLQTLILYRFLLSPYPCVLGPRLWMTCPFPCWLCVIPVTLWCEENVEYSYLWWFPLVLEYDVSCDAWLGHFLIVLQLPTSIDYRCCQRAYCFQLIRSPCVSHLLFKLHAVSKTFEIVLAARYFKQTSVQRTQFSFIQIIIHKKWQSIWLSSSRNFLESLCVVFWLCLWVFVSVCPFNGITVMANSWQQLL